MIAVTCVEKYTEKGKITAYCLMDKQGQKKTINAKDLKEHIRQGEIQVDNLKLTSDNRLITIEKKPQHKESNILNRAKVMGLDIKEIKTFDNKICYLINQGETNNILYIPSNVTKIAHGSYDIRLKPLRKLSGRLVVIGGEGLESANNIFQDCKIQEIILNKFKPRELSNVDEMFRNCITNNIDMSHINIYEKADRETMFYNCKANITLSNKEYQAQFNSITRELVEHNIHIQIKTIDEIYSAIRVIRYNKDKDNSKDKLIYQSKIKNTELLRALLDLTDNIVEVSNKHSDLISTIENLTPLGYYKFTDSDIKNTWSIKLDEVFNECKCNTVYTISAIENNECKFSLYKMDTNEVIKANLSLSNLRDYLYKLNDRLNLLQSIADEESVRDLEQFDRTYRLHEKMIEEFYDIKEDIENNGVIIAIDAFIIEHNKDGSEDTAYNEIEIYGYNNASNFQALLTMFTSDDKNHVSCDLGFWDENTTYIKEFIYKLEELASKCENGTVIKLVIDKENCTKFNDVYRVESPHKIKFSINGKITKVEI